MYTICTCSQPIPEGGYPKKNRTYGASTLSVHTAYIYTYIQLIREGGYPKNDCTRFPSQAYTVKFPSTPILAELTLKRSPKELRSIDTTSWPTSAATERCWKSRQSLIAEWNHKAKWQWQIRMSITCKPTCNLTDLTQKIQYDTTLSLELFEFISNI